MTMTKQATTEKEEAIKRLRKDCGIKPGTRIYTTVRHVSASGMSRVISLFVVDSNRQILNITGLVAKAVGYPMDYRRFGIKSSGCGMDMCFEAVYSLGATLWPKGTPKPHGTRNGEPDYSGGYALRKEDL